MAAAAVAIGIGAIVQTSPTVYTVIKLIGTGYLVYLGIQTIRDRRALREAFEPGRSRSVPSGPSRKGSLSA